MYNGFVIQRNVFESWDFVNSLSRTCNTRAWLQMRLDGHITITSHHNHTTKQPSGTLLCFVRVPHPQRTRHRMTHITAACTCGAVCGRNTHLCTLPAQLTAAVPPGSADDLHPETIPQRPSPARLRPPCTAAPLHCRVPVSWRPLKLGRHGRLASSRGSRYAPPRHH